MSENENAVERDEYDNSKVIHVIATGPGDKTVRPCRPALRALAEGVQEKQLGCAEIKLPEQFDQSEQK